jgi:hypothetical protein
MINNFEAARKMLNWGDPNEKFEEVYPLFRQRLDLFFIDYELIPLLVQESYLNTMGNR